MNKVDAGQNVIKVLKACVHPDQIPSCKACDRMTCEKCVASVKQEAWNESILAEHDTMFLMHSGAWDSCAQEDEFEVEADASREIISRGRKNAHLFVVQEKLQAKFSANECSVKENILAVS